MSIFYINADKDDEGTEFFDKYDLAKFIDGHSDIPEEIKERVKIATGEVKA